MPAAAHDAARPGSPASRTRTPAPRLASSYAIASPMRPAPRTTIMPSLFARAGCGLFSDSLEDDHRLDDIVALLVHHVEGRFELVEREGVRREGRRVDPPLLQDLQQTAQAQASSGTQGGLDRLFCHPYAPRFARNRHGVAFAVVAH